MKKTLIQNMIFILAFYSIEAIAQKMPRRIYSIIEQNDPMIRPNSPRFTSRLLVEYTDGTVSDADVAKIKRTIPGAKQALRKSNNAMWGVAGLCVPTLGSFGLTIFGIANKKPLAIGAGVVGMVGSVWCMKPLFKIKRENYAKFFNLCNDYYAKELKKKGLSLEHIQPDVIQWGAIDNNIGLSLKWQLSK